MRRVLGLFAIAMIFCLIQEINLDDETWFLQVVRRMLSGELLYRDIHFGVTPLSAYFSSAICAIFGVELLAMRVLLAAYFVASALLIFAILKELGILRSIGWSLAVTLFVLAHPQANWGFSGYNGLAKVFFLATFLFALQNRLLFAAVAAGLCAATKQNVGAIAFLALIVHLFARGDWRTRGFWKECGVVSALFGGAFVITLLPTLLLGGWSSFVDSAIWNKSRYLQITDHPAYFSYEEPFAAYALFVYCAPFLAVVGLIFSWFRTRPERLVWTTVVIFFCAAVAVLYPRADHMQKAVAIPFFLIAILYSYDKLRSPIPAWPLVWIWLIIGGIERFPIAALELWWQGRAKLSHLSHFRALLVKKDSLKHWARLKRECLLPRQGTYFLSTHAGFYFILFDLQNPTPFDYPIHPALGLHGENELLSAVERGEIRCIVFDHPDWSNWEEIPPVRRALSLEAFMGKQMDIQSFGTIFEIFIRR